MKENRRSFWLGMGVGLFVFLTAAGMLAVDYQGRKLSFGDSTPLARMDRRNGKTQLAVKAFGHQATWDITALDEAWHFVLDFGCLPGGKAQ